MTLLKTQISSTELKYLADEFQLIVESKIDQIYQLDKKDIIIQLHKTGIGKLRLRINSPSFIYLSENKPEVIPPKGFCMTLRKHLSSARIRSISQIGFERIIDILFETKDNQFHLFIELFGKGNIIFTDSDKRIILPAEHQRWADRHIKPGEIYVYPERESDILKISADGLKKLIEISEKEIVKTLAVDLGLGGIYAEEILKIASIDKKSKTITDEEVQKLNSAIKEFMKISPSPQIITDEKGNIIDIIPVALSAYERYEKKQLESYSKAFDEVLWTAHKTETVKESTSAHDKKIEKVKKMIRMQESSFKKLKQSEEESTKVAELIYSNYQLIDDLLKQIKIARETMSWQEIKDKLKGHKIIREIKEKEGKILIELE
mgnify:CR=1 FL=1